MVANQALRSRHGCHVRINSMLERLFSLFVFKATCSDWRNWLIVLFGLAAAFGGGVLGARLNSLLNTAYWAVGLALVGCVAGLSLGYWLGQLGGTSQKRNH